jgi:hypothetical protein
MLYVNAWLDEIEVLAHIAAVQGGVAAARQEYLSACQQGALVVEGRPSPWEPWAPITIEAFCSAVWWRDQPHLMMFEFAHDEAVYRNVQQVDERHHLIFSFRFPQAHERRARRADVLALWPLDPVPMPKGSPRMLKRKAGILALFNKGYIPGETIGFPPFLEMLWKQCEVAPDAPGFKDSTVRKHVRDLLKELHE